MSETTSAIKIKQEVSMQAVYQQANIMGNMKQ